MTSAEIIEAARKQAEEFAAASQGNGNGDGGGGYGGDGGGDFQIFGQVMLRQVDRRVELLRNATKLDPVVAEGGAGAEEIEVELENVN